MQFWSDKGNINMLIITKECTRARNYIIKFHTKKQMKSNVDKTA